MDTPERDAARAECAKSYYAMQQADKKYQAALAQEYGKEAGDMRYQTKKQPPEIRALGEAYVIASDAWREKFNSIPA